MCGIALLVGPGARENTATFAAMLETVRPRGEVEETLLDDEALLGTHRLRIVDRDRAVQPWTSADGRWALSYNGEIFNFESLREQLLSEGHELRSISDTEVALEGVLAWGEHALLRFRGEFAFGLVDRHTRRVFLARDPAGVKPLYWTVVDGRLAVASEVKSLVGPLGPGITVHEVPPYAWQGAKAFQSWGADLEMTWFERFGAADSLRGILTDYRDQGVLNVIGEGQAWHLCLSPQHVPAYRDPSLTTP